MGRWTECYGDSVFVKNGLWTSWRVAAAHNADCDAYEAKIAELERRDDIVSRERAAAEIRCAELECRIARIAALVKAPGWADIVEAGGRLELTTDRLDAIRAILEEEG